MLDIILVLFLNKGIRIEFFGDEIDRIREFDVLIGFILGERNYVVIMLVFYFVILREIIEEFMGIIEDEFEDRLKEFNF